MCVRVQQSSHVGIEECVDLYPAIWRVMLRCVAVAEARGTNAVVRMRLSTFSSRALQLAALEIGNDFGGIVFDVIGTSRTRHTACPSEEVTCRGLHLACSVR